MESSGFSKAYPINQTIMRQSKSVLFGFLFVRVQHFPLAFYVKVIMKITIYLLSNALCMSCRLLLPQLTKVNAMASRRRGFMYH